jgi:hypothetical protein
MIRIARKLQRRRDERAFARALHTASPAMEQELYAAAAHQSSVRMS